MINDLLIIIIISLFISNNKNKNIKLLFVFSILLIILQKIYNCINKKIFENYEDSNFISKTNENIMNYLLSIDNKLEEFKVNINNILEKYKNNLKIYCFRVYIGDVWNNGSSNLDWWQIPRKPLGDTRTFTLSKAFFGSGFRIIINYEQEFERQPIFSVQYGDINIKDYRANRIFIPSIVYTEKNSFSIYIEENAAVYQNGFLDIVMFV